MNKKTNQMLINQLNEKNQVMIQFQIGMKVQQQLQANLMILLQQILFKKRTLNQFPLVKFFQILIGIIFILEQELILKKKMEIGVMEELQI